MLGTILSVLNLAISLGIVSVLIVYRKRLFAEVDPLSLRQYERLNGRLDIFERTLKEDAVARGARFDLIEAALNNRASEEIAFRHEIIETEHNQLGTMQKVHNELEVLVRKVNWVGETMAKVPCIEGTGTIKNPTPCPEEETG